jgi:hypothetical protein
MDAPTSEDVPTLYQHAMNLSAGIDVDKVRAEAIADARDMDVLCDHGSYKNPLRKVERSILFSEDAFWTYIAGKERANILYLTTPAQTLKYTAAVWCVTDRS